MQYPTQKKIKKRITVSRLSGSNIRHKIRRRKINHSSNRDGDINIHHQKFWPKKSQYTKHSQQYPSQNVANYHSFNIDLHQYQSHNIISLKNQQNITHKKKCYESMEYPSRYATEYIITTNSQCSKGSLNTQRW